MRVNGTIDIAAPCGEVWPYLTEPDKCMDWFDNLEAYEWEGADRDVGSPFHWKERSGSRVYALDFVTTEWDEGRVFAYEMRSGDFFKGYRERWTLTPTDTGCRFGFDDRIDFPWGPFGALIGAMAKRRSVKDGGRVMANLKRLAESPPT